MNEFIYYLRDPNDGTVRYVGKSKNPVSRYHQHIKKLDALPTRKRKWLEGLFAKNQLPILEVAEECYENIAREREQYHLDLNKATALNIHNPAKGARSVSGMYPKKKENY